MPAPTTKIGSIKIYCAKYESRNFTFEAFGQSKEEAIKTIHRGLSEHAKQFGLSPDWWKVYENDLYVQEFKTGFSYRDGHQQSVHHE